MKIILSAYGCSPVLGSEPGVGWHWASSIAKTHEVTLITHPFFQESINQQLAKAPIEKLTIHYYEPRCLGVRRKPGSLNSRFYYILWQFGAYLMARKLTNQLDFDFVHHITWGTYRLPSFMGLLGLHFVFGPVGGGESAPWKLYRGLPYIDRIKELIRSFVVFSGRYDPLVRMCLAKSSLILCKTIETYMVLPHKIQRKALVTHEIGAPSVIERGSNRSLDQPLRLLYAGRLIGWKGVHLAIRALATSISHGYDLRLTIIGSGTLGGYLKTLTQRLGVSEFVEFLGHIPQDELMMRYQGADVFLFPSLHDSSGNVVLEALSRGLPVICLDLGGPATFVNDSCGVIVEARNALNVEHLVKRISLAIESICDLNEEEFTGLVNGALTHAKELSWDKQVTSVYQLIEEKINVRLSSE